MNDKFQRGGGKDPKKFENCKLHPIKLFHDGHDGTHFLSLFPPPPLHCILLGAPVNLINILNTSYPEEMSLFYSKQQNTFSEQAIAGSLTGADVRHLYSDAVAGDLRDELNNTEDEENLGDDVFNFLKAVEAVWVLSNAKELNPDFQKIIDDYERCLRTLYDRIRLPCTPKSHVILQHFPEYFSLHKKTMWLTSDEPIENSHSKMRKFEERHGYHTTKRLYGTPLHKQRALDSIILFNYLRLGF